MVNKRDDGVMNPLDTKEIRAELQQGNSIDNVCRKYKLSFNELVRLMQSGLPIRKGRTRKGWLYIQFVGNRYHIQKGSVHYGTYETLEDAQRIRDWLVRHGWDKSQVDLACDWCSVKRCKK